MIVLQVPTGHCTTRKHMMADMGQTWHPAESGRQAWHLAEQGPRQHQQLGRHLLLQCSWQLQNAKREAPNHATCAPDCQLVCLPGPANQVMTVLTTNSRSVHLSTQAPGPLH